MHAILFLIFAVLVSLAPLDAMQQPQQPQDHKFTQQLTEAIDSQNIRILRLLLIDALDKKNRVRTKIILSHIGYDDAYSLIITWVPDTDASMADKIQTWLNFLHIFAPPIDEDEDFGELNSPVIYEPRSDSQGIFAPYTPTEKEDGL